MAKPTNPIRHFDSSPEVIRMVVMMYVKYPLSLRNLEDLLAERGIDICHETVRLWWKGFGPMFAAEIRRKRANAVALPASCSRKHAYDLLFRDPCSLHSDRPFQGRTLALP